jgi:pantetheine-phosphate adenylyltransferase
MQKEKIHESVILPGSYDPVTLGHLEMIRRAAERYDEVYAVIFTNPDKTYTFSLEDRVKMLILATDELENVLVSYSNGLVIDYVREHEINRIVKGYRNETDLEYEKKQAEWNLYHGGVETELVRAEEKFEAISSTEARRRLLAGEALDEILPRKVIDFIKSR